MGFIMLGTLNQLCEARRFRAHDNRELLRRTACNIQAFIHESLPNFRTVQHARDFLIDSIHQYNVQTPWATLSARQMRRKKTLEDQSRRAAGTPHFSALATAIDIRPFRRAFAVSRILPLPRFLCPLHVVRLLVLIGALVHRWRGLLWRRCWIGRFADMRFLL